MRFWAACPKHYETVKIRLALQKNLDLGSNSLYYRVAIFAGLSIAVSRHMARFQHVRFIVDSSPSG